MLSCYSVSNITYNPCRFQHGRCRQIEQPQQIEQTNSTLCHSTSASDSRIINLEQLNKYLNRVSAHAATCVAYQNESAVANDMMVLVEQTRYGLESIIAYQCCGCGQRISFCTSPKVTSPEGKKCWSCNLATIWGQMATGGGFNKLEESMSVLGVPVMSRKVFVNT